MFKCKSKDMTRTHDAIFGFRQMGKRINTPHRVVNRCVSHQSELHFNDNTDIPVACFVAGHSILWG